MSLGAVGIVSREWVTRHRLASLLVVLLALGAVPSLVFALRPEGGSIPRPRHVDHRYATQSGSLYGARRQNIAQQNQEVLDSALETCAGIGLGPLATRYRL